MNLNAFKATVNGISSLKVSEDNEQLTVRSRGGDQPFFAFRKADSAIDLKMSAFDASQSDFAQFSMAMGATFMQSSKPTEPLHAYNAFGELNKEDVLAVVDQDGGVDVLDKSVEGDDLSIMLVQYVFNKAVEDHDDPILTLIGLARIVEGKWNYSDEEQGAANN